MFSVFHFSFNILRTVNVTIALLAFKYWYLLIVLSFGSLFVPLNSQSNHTLVQLQCMPTILQTPMCSTLIFYEWRVSLVFPKNSSKKALSQSRFKFEWAHIKLYLGFGDYKDTMRRRKHSKNEMFLPSC